MEVTARDIALGHPGQPSSCPLARALKRAFRYKRRVRVGLDTLWVGVDPLPHTERTASFMDMFDDRRPVKPFSFVLRLP